MSREAIKLALEALEYASTGNRRAELIAPAITALREALAEQPAQQEPVACVEYISCCTDKTCSKCKAATPPQRKPLTDEELDAMFSKTLKGKKLVNWVARAIEAAHGIKENT